MPAPFNLRIRKGEPWLFRVLNWKDPNGNVLDPTLYSWRLRTAAGAGLSINGTVATGVVSFSLDIAQTEALRFSQSTYVVEATPIGGGDPYRVLEGRLSADADAVAS